MWNETNFLLKGFINEVKGTLTGNSGSDGVSGINVASRSNGGSELTQFIGGPASIPALTIKAAFNSAVDN